MVILIIKIKLLQDYHIIMRSDAQRTIRMMMW